MRTSLENKASTKRVFLPAVLPLHLLRSSTLSPREKAQQRRLVGPARKEALGGQGCQQLPEAPRAPADSGRQLKALEMLIFSCRGSKRSSGSKAKITLEPITPEAHIFFVSGVCQLQWATGRDKIMILASYYRHQL